MNQDEENLTNLQSTENNYINECANEKDIFFPNDDKIEQNIVKHERKASKKNPRRSEFFEKTVSIFMAITVLVMVFMIGYGSSKFDKKSDGEIAEWVVELMNEHAYFNNQELTSYDIMKFGIEALIDDPYFTMRYPAETKAMQSQYNGSAVNIGMTVAAYDGVAGVIVQSVTKGSNADKAGVEPYQRLVKIGDTDCWAITMEELTPIITGFEENVEFTAVMALPQVDDYGNVKYSRDNTVELTLVRAEYEPQVVTYYDNSDEEFRGILNDDTAYIDIDSFVGKTEEQFDKAMAEYKENGKSKLILDLRDNGGGSDYNLAGVGKYLLTDGENENVMILREQYKGDNERILSTNECLYDEYDFDKIIVLVNNNSASASEALLLAMKDYETVDAIVGETTFGKGTGLMTATEPTTNYSITFTASYFFSPLGNSNEAVGIQPTDGYREKPEWVGLYSYENDNILQRAVSAMN